ncbi:MAG: nucleotide exchange factor GrpE [Candidatus Paceibacterota bacterium]
MMSENQEDKKPKDENFKKERDEYLEGWKRAKADLVNYKKEEAKRFMEMAKFASEDLIVEMITILDSFDLGLAALEKDGKAEKGLYLIRTQLEDALRKRGLERVIISVGQPFDPALQEAVTEIKSDKSSGTVIEEVERGYFLNGKLIRPVRVKVAK